MSRYGDGADISGSLTVGGEAELGSGDDDIDIDAGTLFVDAGNNRVGIGTESPSYTLEVAGNMGVNEYIYHNGDANTLINFADDKIILKAGGKAMITMEEKASSPHEVTINDGSNNVDFVVKGNGSNAGNPGMNFDASTNRLGINGVGSPSYELDVAGDIGLSEYIYHKGDDDTFIRFETDQITVKAGNVSFINITEDDSQDKISLNEGRDDVDFIVRSPNNALALYLNAGNEVFHINHNETVFKTKIHSTNGEAITVDNNGVILNEDGADANDFRVESDTDTHMLFVNAGNDNIGIGTSSPSTSAILELSSSNKGLMLPRVLSASKPTATSALNGLMLYEEDTHRLKIVANGAWQTISYE